MRSQVSPASSIKIFTLTDMVRIGSRSKSERISELNLNNRIHKRRKQHMLKDRIYGKYFAEKKSYEVRFILSLTLHGNHHEVAQVVVRY